MVTIATSDWASALWWMYNASAMKAVVGLGLLGAIAYIWPALIAAGITKREQGRDELATPVSDYNRRLLSIWIWGVLATIASILTVLFYALVIKWVGGETSKVLLPEEAKGHLWMLVFSTVGVVAFFVGFYVQVKRFESAKDQLG